MTFGATEIGDGLGVVGVSMGHNEKLAWGLTITGTDFQDVFIEDLNPANSNEILYNGKPEALKIITEEFQIKGEAPRTVELKFSRHGPDAYASAAYADVFGDTRFARDALH